jgi:hypothetical protein
MSEGKPMTGVIIYGGKTGWIGGLMHQLLKEKHRKSAVVEACLLTPGCG